MALLLAVLAVAGWAWFELHEPYAGWEGEAAEIVLEPGLHAGQVLRRLAAAGVLQHPRLARAWLSWRGGAELTDEEHHREVEEGYLFHEDTD